MKKLLLTSLFILSSLASYSQTWIGGALNYTNIKNDDGASLNETFTIAPEIGFTFSSRWSGGVNLMVSFIDNDSQELNAYAIRPFVRYSFLQSGRVTFFVEGAAELGYLYYDKHQNWMEYGFGIYPGVKLAVSDRVSLVAKLGALSYSKIADHESTFNFGVSGENLSLGIYLNL